MNNNFNINNICISEEEINCIENIEFEYKYLIKPIDENKTHSLVLDIDETLLSVRRWIDETQINDFVFYNKLNKLLKIKKITKEVTLQYDDGVVNVYSFYFNQQEPFGQLNSSLDVGDRMDIGGRLASVKEVLTSYITIFDEEDSNKEIEINCLNDDYLNELKYYDNKHEKENKFSKPDLVYNNMYLVRFRSGLYEFFEKMVSYKNLEIILWTAAVRKVYTDLMNQVQNMILNKLNNKNINKIWTHILFRDNCTVRDNGSYFKDLSLLGRDYNNLIMIDNISFNFQGFEYNGLPIQEYYGHLNDNELYKFCQIMDELMIPTPSNYDIRRVLHHFAFVYDFSINKLDFMLSYLRNNNNNNHSHSNKTTPTPSMSQSTADIADIAEPDFDMKPPPTPIFDQDEVELDDMQFPSSSNQQDCMDGGDSIPTSLESSATSSNEDSDKHLDYYLFNLSPAAAALDKDEFIDFEQDDDDIFSCPVDPTLLSFN